MIIGTAGHIDHGKTALVRALTGIDTDRLKEEKARGITIDLGFAYLPLPDGRVLGFVDVPGHEKFVHNMLAGATGIDFVLLAVAADDGVMPQTREHLAIVDLLGLSHGIVALTKCDLAGAERRSIVSADIAVTLAATGLRDAAVIPVSTVTGEGLAALRTALETAAAAFHERGGEGRFRLAVDRSFSLTGAGTIVTGTVLSGSVAVGDRVAISPSGRSARVRAIHAQNRPTETGHAGQRCALNLAGEGIVREAIHRGDVVLDPALHAPADRIDATLRVLRSEPRPIGQWMPVRLHHGAAEIAARIVLLGDAPIAPGNKALVQLVLERPIAAAAGDHFVLRDTSAQRTIGGGRFLDLRAPARKRRTPERLAQLAAHALADPERILAALAALPCAAINIAAFARDHALGAAQTERIVGRLGLIGIAVPGGMLAFAPAEWLRLKRAIAATLADYHAANPDLSGMGRERLRLAVAARLAAPAFAAVLHGLAQHGEIVLDGSWVRLREHEVRLTPADAAVWSRMHDLLAGRERFRPPRARDIGGLLNMPEVEIRRILKLLGRMGKVDEVAHDHFFLRDTVAEMVGIMAGLAARSDGDLFNAAAFRDQLDNGRKVAIQILEFFDRHGVTLRRGDLRRINRHRLDLFGRPPETGPQTQPGAAAFDPLHGREAFPVGRPDFKSGRGRETVSGGFDSHSLPPHSRSAR
ncbi:MAG: selenocysteine-specific translation elongation factor [Xanthobacteraceae bacterium]|nr:MAG: selenocysteine-specific translation elongation factor [Xanthobacteraceae bacterium]